MDVFIDVPAFRDKAYLETTADLFESVIAQVHAALERGIVPLAKVQAAVNAGKLKGDEPDIAHSLSEARRIVSVIQPADRCVSGDAVVDGGSRRLAAVGALSPARAARRVAEDRAAVATAVHVVTPGMLATIAVLGKTLAEIRGRDFASCARSV